MSNELKRPNKKDYYDLLGGFMPVTWDRDVKEYIDQIESKLEEAEKENKVNLRQSLIDFSAWEWISASYITMDDIIEDIDMYLDQQDNERNE